MDVPYIKTHIMKLLNVEVNQQNINMLYDLIKLKLDSDFDVNTIDTDRKTLLYYLVELYFKIDKEIVLELIKKTLLKDTLHIGKYPTHIIQTMTEGHESIYNHRDLINFILSLRFDINFQLGYFKRTFLMLICHNINLNYTNDDFLDMVSNIIDIVNKVFIYPGFDINIKDKNGRSVIYYAIDVTKIMHIRDDASHRLTKAFIRKFLVHPNLSIDSEDLLLYLNDEHVDADIVHYIQTFIHDSETNSDISDISDISENMEKTEEDTESDTESISGTESISSNYNYENVENCVNDNLIMLEKYTYNDSPFMIYTLNSVGKFEKAICSTQDEWNNYIMSDINNLENRDAIQKIPMNIMSLGTIPRDGNMTGVGSKPTNNIVIKMPINQLYITLGSAIRINREYEKNKIWYAFPMYNGKRKRVTNLKGVIGSSMNHGQVPGFVIYKLYKIDELENVMQIAENGDYLTHSDDGFTDERIIKIINSIIGNIPTVLKIDI